MMKQRYGAAIATLALAAASLTTVMISGCAHTFGSSGSSGSSSSGDSAAGSSSSGSDASSSAAAPTSIGNGSEVGQAGVGNVPPPQVKMMKMAPRSGFLSPEVYAKLKPAPDRDGVEMYIDRSKDYHNFNKIMFDPVEVYVVPNPDYKGLPREALTRMTGDFQRAFMKALTPGYTIVTTPGPDVLRVRMAITGVQPASRKLGPTDFIPIKALYNAGRKAAGASPKVAEMTGEFEVLTPDNTVAGAATATRKGDEHLPQGDQITWKEMQEIADYWAKGFRQRLDEVRGVTTVK